MGGGGGHCVEPLMPPTSPHLSHLKKKKERFHVQFFRELSEIGLLGDGGLVASRTYWFCDLKKGFGVILDCFVRLQSLVCSCMDAVGCWCTLVWK